MFGSSLVRYWSFSVRVNFRSIISGVNSGRISVCLVRVVRIGSLLPGLMLICQFIDFAAVHCRCNFGVLSCSDNIKAI